VAERAGVINLGLEGAIIAGAFGALAGAGLGGGVASGFAVGVLAGLAAAALFAVFAVALRSDQIITGTAVTLAALGSRHPLPDPYGAGGAALATPTTPPLPLPGLSGCGRGAGPVRATAGHLPAVPARAGRVVVHDAHARRARPARGGRAPRRRGGSRRAPRRVQLAAVLFGGLLGGISGATLVVAQAGTFAEGMSAGRGFIAIAVVVLGGGTRRACCWPSSSSARRVRSSTSSRAWGGRSPTSSSSRLPYVLTLVVPRRRRPGRVAGACRPLGRRNVRAAEA
jgi:simple sugar transport system permease protein